MADKLSKIAEESVRGGFFLISGATLSTIIMAVGTILVGRLLGAELYGQYNLAFVAPQLLFLFTDLGINQGIIKFAASLRSQGEDDRVTKIIQTGLIFRVLVGIAIFTLNFALADIFAVLINRPNIGNYIQIASISIIFQVIVTTANSAFVGLDKTEYNAITQNIQATVKTILSVALILIGYSITGAIMGYIAGYIIGSIIAAAILFFKLLKHSETIENNGFIQNLRTLATYGMPLYISILLTGFLPLYYSLILAFFTTDFDIGNFKAATNFIALISIISGPITTTLLTAFSKLSFANPNKIKDFFRIAHKYTCLLIVSAATLIIILSKEIVQTVYGATYETAPAFLSVYSLLYFLVAIGYLTLTSLFNGLGKTRITLKITLTHFLVFLILAPILTSPYGVLGLIAATLISNTIATSYASYIAKTEIKIEFATRSVTKIFLISAISSIPSLILVHLTPLPEIIDIILAGALYIIIYATLTPFAKIINDFELQTAKNIMQKIGPLAFITRPLLEYQEKILHYRNQ